MPIYNNICFTQAPKFFFESQDLVFSLCTPLCNMLSFFMLGFNYLMCIYIACTYLYTYVKICGIMPLYKAKLYAWVFSHSFFFILFFATPSNSSEQSSSAPSNMSSSSDDKNNPNWTKVVFVSKWLRRIVLFGGIVYLVYLTNEHGFNNACGGLVAVSVEVKSK